MKSNAKLLDMYKVEKELIIGGDPDRASVLEACDPWRQEGSRTGLEPFPTFAEWKAEYVKEYLNTHKNVSEEEADAILAAAVEEAEAELKAIMVVADEEIEPKVKPAVKAKAERKSVAKKKTPAKKKPATKKKVAKKSAPAKKKGSSKTDKAQKIFDRFYGRKTRAEIIEKFCAQCDLTANGAATYYQKFKKAAG
jgi:hypothetical protein